MGRTRSEKEPLAQVSDADAVCPPFSSWCAVPDMGGVATGLAGLPPDPPYVQRTASVGPKVVD